MRITSEKSQEKEMLQNMLKTYKLKKSKKCVANYDTQED